MATSWSGRSGRRVRGWINLRKWAADLLFIIGKTGMKIDFGVKFEMGTPNQGEGIITIRQRHSVSHFQSLCSTKSSQCNADVPTLTFQNQINVSS